MQNLNNLSGGPDEQVESKNGRRSSLAGAIMLMASAIAATGCEDGGGYELVSGPGCTNCSDAGTDNGQEGADPGNPPNENGCKPVPSFWDMRSYKGCMTTADMAGVYRNSNHQEFGFEGKPFADNNGIEQGELFYMTNPNSSDCGPVKVAMVSNSGTEEIKVEKPVKFSLMQPELAELTWQKLHNGQAPTEVDLLSVSFSSLLLDIYECETSNPNCSLKNQVPGGLPGGQVLYQTTGTNAVNNGSYCGWMYTVMESQ